MSTEKSVASEMEPIFLELGKALLVCQSLEVSLRSLNALLAHGEADGEEGEFGASLDLYSNESLGQLINTLRKRIDIPAELSDYLESGLKIRNEIVHDSMTRNIERFTHPAGRLAVAFELAGMKKEVKKRNIVVNKFMDTLFAKNGCPDPDLKRNADDLWSLQIQMQGQHGTASRPDPSINRSGKSTHLLLPSTP